MSEHKRWFKRVRGSYLPCSWQGWLLYFPYSVFLISVLLAASRNTHSISDMLYAVFAQFVCATVVMTWVASQKS